MKRLRSIFIPLYLLWLVPVIASAAQDKKEITQEKKEITVEWIFSDQPRAITRLPAYVWLSDGTALLQDPRKPVNQRTFERLNPATGKREPALDMQKAIASLRAARAGDAPASLPWPDAFDGSGRQAFYLFDGDIYLLTLGSAEFRRVTKTAAEEKSVNFSPDGEHIAFVRDNDLYIYDIKPGREKRLTHDGSETILNGTLSWLYWEEVFGRRDIGYWWSNDSKAIAYLQTDESAVGVMHYLDHRSLYPRLIKQRYPKAGEPNPIVRAAIVSIDDGKTAWVDLKKDAYEYLIRVQWLPSNDRLSVQTMNRAQDHLDLYFVDRATGHATHILKETDEAWVNFHDDLYFLKDGKHFIWASERDGYAHLYRYTMDGKLVNQITRGPWAIRSSGGVFWLRQAVNAIDEKEGWIYFSALEKSSIEQHLYRIKLDGTGLKRLTKEDGTHSVRFSPDARYYFDAYSNIMTPPSLTLHESDGPRAQVVAEARPELLAPYGIEYPQLMSIPAADGFQMPAQLLKPKDFDPKKRYPLIVFVYGGPSAPSVSNSWQFQNYFNQLLLKQGYLVAVIDNRSATAISKKLENTIKNQMYGEGELNDLVAGVKWLKSQSYVDPARVGVWGWSGGGTFTLLAMTRSREFKAGIAVAAVTDQRYYDTKWSEFTMRKPSDNPQAYEKSSLVRTAKDLHGRLLLVHGTYDDNVHIQNAWAFIDELIKAGKTFDLMVYPMRQHGISDRPASIHLYNTMLEFWAKNL